jgi:hypothetical protein
VEVASAQKYSRKKARKEQDRTECGPLLWAAFNLLPMQLGTCGLYNVVFRYGVSHHLYLYGVSLHLTYGPNREVAHTSKSQHEFRGAGMG